jgi:putative oxidoreductase
VFLGALTSVIIRGLNIDCGCFRQGGEATSPWVALARDIGIFGALVYLIRGRIPARDSSRNGLQPPSP